MDPRHHNQSPSNENRSLDAKIRHYTNSTPHFVGRDERRESHSSPPSAPPPFDSKPPIPKKGDSWRAQINFDAAPVQPQPPPIPRIRSCRPHPRQNIPSPSNTRPTRPRPTHPCPIRKSPVERLSKYCSYHGEEFSVLTRRCRGAHPERSATESQRSPNSKRPPRTPAALLNRSTAS